MTIFVSVVTPVAPSVGVMVTTVGGVTSTEPIPPFPDAVLVVEPELSLPPSPFPTSQVRVFEQSASPHPGPARRTRAPTKTERYRFINAMFQVFDGRSTRWRPGRCQPCFEMLCATALRRRSVQAHGFSLRNVEDSRNVSRRFP